MDLNGKTYDFVGGLKDFQNQNLRFVGNPVTRVQEDSLRILRYLRFSAQLGWNTNLEHTLTMLQPYFHLQANLSEERIWQELKKMLRGTFFIKIFPYLQKYQPLLPINFHFIEGSTLNTLITAYPAATAAQRLYIAAKMPPHFCFSKKEWRELKDLKAAITKLKRYTPIQTAVITTQSATAAAMALHGMAKPQIDAFLSQSIPIFPLSGKDVLNLSIPPSPKVGHMLKEVQTWWLNNNFPPKEKCLTRLESLLK